MDATSTDRDPERRGRQATVLVIDDEGSEGPALSELLRREGCRVIRARGGAEALSILQGMIPDLIILDLSARVVTDSPSRRRVELQTLRTRPRSICSRYGAIPLRTRKREMTAMVTRPPHGALRRSPG